MELSAETIDFIEQNAEEDVRTLALKAKRVEGVDLPLALTQIAGRQTARHKLPTWGMTDGILYAPHLPLEQCSSETTARYKATLVSGESFTDLTAGFGVDCFFLSTRFRRATYVERQSLLCDIARHNFPLLMNRIASEIETELSDKGTSSPRESAAEEAGRTTIEVVNADCAEYLQRMEKVDCLFIDPARRDVHGRKTVAIADCEPDICQLEHLLLQKGETVLIKLSPMLDITQALRILSSITDVYVVSVQNECKELLLRLSSDKASTDEPQIHCVNLIPRQGHPSVSVGKATETDANAQLKGFGQLKDFVSMKGSYQLENSDQLKGSNQPKESSTCSNGIVPLYILPNGVKVYCSSFSFTPREETSASIAYTDVVGHYLYEPNTSLLKAGAHNSVGIRYGLQKLHPNSHLYTGDTLLPDFPGRCFIVEQTWGFSKKELKAMAALRQANVTIRNFPSSVNDLRKKFHLTDGGDTYLFATTLSSGEKALIQCRKA